MKILITGHMGALGRHLGRLLKSDEAEIHGSDIRAGTDPDNMFQVNDVHYDLVFHCASLGYPFPRRMEMEARFFNWADKTKPKCAVVLSEDWVYPKCHQREPYRLKESDAAPDTATSWGLRAIEEMALEREMHVFRPFQVYGEGGVGLFEVLIQMVVERKDPFFVPEAGNVYDFIHAKDAAQAIIEAIKQGEKGPMNLCTGEPTAIDDLALTMFRAAEWEPERFFNECGGEEFFRCGDASKMDSVRKATTPLAKGIYQELKPTGS